MLKIDSKWTRIEAAWPILRLLLLYRVNFIDYNYFRNCSLQFYSLNSMNTNIFISVIYLRWNYFQESFIEIIFDPQIFKNINQIHNLISVMIYVCNILQHSIRFRRQGLISTLVKTLWAWRADDQHLIQGKDISFN